MPIDDFLDPAQESRRLKKAQQRAWVSGGNSGGGDTNHPGSGEESVQIGERAAADWYSSVAIGPDAKAQAITDDESGEGIAIGSQATADGFGTTAVGGRAYAQWETSTAIGWSADALHLRSTAIGENAVTTQADQIRLGRSGQQVSVPGNLVVNGTFSNPSARRLKRDIIPAPTLRDVFPELVEYEYIDGDGARRIGYIADDLVGTEAGRFVSFDAEGRAEAIDIIGLLVAQVAVLNARLVALEERG
jgi:hypothetical protein